MKKCMIARPDPALPFGRDSSGLPGVAIYAALPGYGVFRRMCSFLP